MLSIEEITLIKMYSGIKNDREAIIRRIESILPYFIDEEIEMKEMASSVIRKLTAMTDDTFNNINLDDALSEDYNVN